MIRRAEEMRCHITTWSPKVLIVSQGAVTFDALHETRAAGPPVRSCRSDSLLPARFRNGRPSVLAS